MGSYYGRVRDRLTDIDSLTTTADGSRPRRDIRRSASAGGSAASAGSRASGRLLAGLGESRPAAVARSVARSVGSGSNRSTLAALAESGITVSSPGDVTEREAASVALAVGRGQSERPTVGARLPASAPGGLPAVVSGALRDGRPLADEVRGPLESALGADLSPLRVHTGGAAAAAASALQARAFTLGSAVVLGAGESPADRTLMAHEATHLLQARPGLVQRDAAPRPGAAALADFPYLRQALTPDQYAMLEDRAISRLAVPLMQLLPPDIAYLSRQEVLTDVFPQLAGVQGAAANAEELVTAIATGETLRIFLEDKLRQPVTIVLGDEGDRPAVRFYLFGLELRSDSGMIPVGALDNVSIATIEAIAVEQQKAAVELVDLRMAEAKAEHAVSAVVPVLLQVTGNPAAYALQEVQDLRTRCRQLHSYLEALSASLHGSNLDLAARLAAHLDMTRSTLAVADGAASTMAAFVTAHWPDTTSGETYADAEDEYADDAGLSPGGLLAAANYGATRVFHFVGSTVTAGHMDREAANAQAYRKGLISWNAYEENQGWNVGISLLVAAATALSAGLAGRAVSGFVGVAAGFTPAGAATITGTVVGGVSGTAGAMASDAGAKIAASITDDRYVRDLQNASVMGPLGWLDSGLKGALLGGLFGRLFGRGRNAGEDLAEAQKALREQAGRTDIAATAPAAVVGEASGPVAFVNGEPVPPTHYSRLYHGNSFTPAEVKASGGFKATGSNWDLIRHTEELSRFDGANDSAFRGATVLPKDAAQWGDWVYEIEGMPAWDTAKILQGKVKVAGMGEYRGALMHGEVEHAVPGEIPLKNIVRFGRTVGSGKGVGVREWYTWDTYKE